MEQPTNIIKGQLRNFKTNSIFNFEVRIVDGGAILQAEDKNFLKDLFKHQVAKGNKNIMLNKNPTMLIEKFDGVSRDEITKKYIKQLKEGGANVTKDERS